MRVLSLFSGGVGAMDMGLEAAGMMVVGQVEIDPWRCMLLEQHWPEIRRMRDVRDVRGDEFGAIDLLAGGPPCQPASSAGKRLGDADERWLWPEYFRLLRTIRPRYALMENPTGLFDKDFFNLVLSGLAESGYDAEWDCLPAAAFGAPHLRDRIWILAYPCEGDGGAERQQQQAPRAKVFGRGSLAEMADAERVKRQRGRITGDVGCQASGAEGKARQRQRGRGTVGDSGTASATMADATKARPAERSGRSAVAECVGDGAADRGSVARGDAPMADTHGEPTFWAAIARGQRNPWKAEPAVGRVVDGPSVGLDEVLRKARIAALGDAQVPQIVEWIGRRIVLADAARDEERAE